MIKQCHFWLYIQRKWKQIIHTKMFTTVLFTIPKLQKQPVCPSVGKWIKRIWHTYRHTHIYIHMGLEDTMLSEIRQTEKIKYSSVQFSSVTQCPTCCDPMTVARQASLSITNSQSSLKLMSIKSDAIKPFHPLPSPSPLAFNLSQHQGLFKWVSSLHQVAKVLEFQLQYQSLQWTFRTDFL